MTMLGASAEALPGELTLDEWVVGKLLVPLSPQLHAPGVKSAGGFRLSRATMQLSLCMVEVREICGILQTVLRFGSRQGLHDEFLVNLDSPPDIPGGGFELGQCTQRLRRNRTRFDLFRRV